MKKIVQKKALVTGGLGFFGSAIVNKLVASGLECRIFDISQNQEDLGPVDIIQGDICDLKAVENACEGIDIVYHNVAQVPLAKNIDKFNQVNIDGTRNLLKAALAKGVKKVAIHPHLLFLECLKIIQSAKQILQRLEKPIALQN